MGNINYNKIYREALRKAAIELEYKSVELQQRLEDQVVNLGVISSSRAGRNFVPEAQSELDAFESTAFDNESFE